MEQQEAQIKRFLETFFNATQIEALYFDREMNMISCHFRGYVIGNFLTLSRGNIQSFLKDIFKNESAAPQNFYTYHLDQNLICNISILYDNGICCGAAITQPVSLSAFKEAEMEAKIASLIQDPEERGEYLSAIRKVPVVSHDRIRSIGEVLGTLSRSALREPEFRQVFCGGRPVSAAHEFLRPENLVGGGRPAPSARQHSGYPIYRKLKDAISKGDTETVLAALNSFDLGSVHLDQQTSKDPIRSLKNSLIEGLAICSFAAIEAGVPYGKARGLTENFIRELESTENITDMFSLIKSALLAFTRAVAVTRIVGYSRPVRQTIEYIEKHYAEKITLKVLSEQANLSEFYLSTLVKKETGSNIADIINKVRIEESKDLLRKSTVSIGELAAMVGYSYSNHFSRVFKQYTGMTPSAYVKMSLASSDKESASKEMMDMLLDQLRHYMLMFPGVFHVIRIVDPISSVAWKAQQAGEAIGDTCYAFWSRKQSCEKCISRMALEQDKPFVKMDQGKGHPFLVFAVPVAVDGKKYVIELLKDVSDNYFDCIKEPAAIR